MYLMYVDESGDSGDIAAGSPTKYFILSAIIFHESRWNSLLLDLINFRRNIKNTKGLKLREEIHSSDFINKPGKLKRIKRNDRLDILKKVIDWIASKNEINVITVVVDKSRHNGNIFEMAWERLIQRFENTIQHNNFPDSIPGHSQKGFIIPDNTDNKKLKALIRRMRRFNPVPNSNILFGSGQRNLAISYVIEDPFMKDSSDSFFHQAADVIAYFARQLFEPNTYVKKKSATHFYGRLMPVINQRVTSGHNNPFHFVRV